MANNKDPKTGHFLPGKSGNPSGRPKAEKLTGKDKKELKKIISKCIKEKDLTEAVLWLVERSEQVFEVFKYLKEFAPYIMPKLSSMKTETKEIREIKITLLGVNNEDEKIMKLVKPIKTEVIENEQ